MADTRDYRELWVGTPNQMARLTNGTLVTIKTRAKRELEERREMAKKFDHSALPGVTEAMEGINSLTPSSFKSGPRTWTFPLISITYRIEVR